MSFIKDIAGSLVTVKQKRQMVRETMIEWAENFAKELNCETHEVRLTIAVNKAGVPFGVLYKNNEKIRTVTVEDFVPDKN